MKQFVPLILLSVLCTVFKPVTVQAQKGNHNFEVVKNLDIFNALYRDLDLYYVDTLDAQKNIDAAAQSMLSLLDPYTEYYTEQGSDELKQMTTGKYVGIGCVTPYRKDLKRCIIYQVFKGMPADEAGVRKGDIVMAIDGKTIQTCMDESAEGVSKYAQEVRDKLRGEPGTTLELRVKRPSVNKFLLFKIKRRNITQPSVTLSTIVSDSVGYIRLSQFIEGTGNEVRRALVDLKQQGARRLILDLRDNPGGVLEEAVNTVNLFIPRSRDIVNTKGKVRELNQTFKTNLDPQDTDLPIVVLVNGGSASAAEITCGALQDYDRAVIMGQRTYGKGLVQQSRELPYKAVLKLTIGKYYIPSGRCIQAYTFKDGQPVHTPDSLTREFRTANGRIVRDGGGITPDITLPTDSLPNLLAYLEASDQLFDYTVQYRSKHERIAPCTQFKLTDEEYADFCKYMKEHNFTYDRQSLRFFAALRRIAEFEGYGNEAKAELDALESKLKHDEDHDFKRWEKEIRRIVEGAIIESYYYNEGLERYNLKDDAEVQRAVRLLHDRKQMYKILSGEPDA